MEKKVFGLFIFALTAIFVIQFASASITLSQPSSTYNLGDTFSSSIVLNPQSDTSDFLVANLICNSGQVNIYKSPFDLQAGGQTNVSVSIKLNRPLIGNLSGNCSLDAKFGSDELETQPFSISDQINLIITAQNSSIDPGSNIILSGSAVKADGNNSNGIIEVNIPGTSSNQTFSFSNGQFSENVLIPDNAQSGQYYLSVFAYENDSSGSTTNHGSATIAIKVNQIIKSVDISLDKSSIVPDSSFSYTPLLTDQAGMQANIDTSVIFYDAKGKIYTQNVVKSGQASTISLPYDAIPGQWSVETYYNNKIANKTFTVEKVSKADFSLDNQTLIVKNAGNVPYSGNVSVIIGNYTSNMSVSLALDEAKRFKLSAPKGNYTISAGDSQNSANLGVSYLTGNAVSVTDANSIGSSSVGPWLWFIIIIILLAVALYYYRKVRTGSYIGRMPISSGSRPKFIPITESSFPSKELDNEVKKVRSEKYNATPISLSSSINGSKEEVAVVALKIKNASKLRDSQSSAFLTIEHLLQKAKLSKAKVYDNGLFKIIIFSPKLTQKTELENSTNAVKMASQIDTAIKEFNKKYAIKIDYGIGAHLGQMFLEFVDGKEKFTSVGNTTIVAKNAAEKANNEIFISSLLHRKVYNIVKGEQTQYGLYKINSILDRSQHSQFIQRFMSKKDKK